MTFFVGRKRSPRIRSSAQRKLFPKSKRSMAYANRPIPYQLAQACAIYVFKDAFERAGDCPDAIAATDLKTFLTLSFGRQ